MLFEKRLLAAALAAALGAGLVAAPAGATPGTVGTRHSHELEWVLKPSFTQWSDDSGTTWTAAESDYTAGEAGTDGGDGPSAGQFRQRVIAEGDPRWSTNAGWSYTGQGAAEPAGFDFTVSQYSGNHGGTWGNIIRNAYLAGDGSHDSNDGPYAGRFRARYPNRRQRTWVCVDPSGGEAAPESGSAEQVTTEIPVGTPAYTPTTDFSAPTTPRCLVWHRGPSLPPYTTNVDDGIEPPGDWCAAGASTIICRGEGYTYREARRELGF